MSVEYIAVIIRCQLEMDSGFMKVSSLAHTLCSMHQYTTGNLYEQVRCKLKVDSGLSNYFLSIMGVKQGYPLSLTLFGLYIIKIGKIVN